MSIQVETNEDNASQDVLKVENEAQSEINPDAVNTDQENNEVVITIGEEAPPQEEHIPAPAWVKDLRKSHREAQKKIKELESQLKKSTPQNQEINLGEKPTLEKCDYDSDKFASEMENWFARKKQIEDRESQLKKEQEAQNRAWEDRLAKYEAGKKEMKVQDYEDAEDVVQNMFDVTQQGILIKVARNPSLMVYALGKNPKKASELASIKDPLELAAAVREMELQVKEVSRKPSPEKTVTGIGVPKTTDATLEKLYEEAMRTGNMDKVRAYKKKIGVKNG